MPLNVNNKQEKKNFPKEADHKFYYRPSPTSIPQNVLPKKKILREFVYFFLNKNSTQTGS